ncbi:MAG TPA: hypothetical protein VD962_02420 [Rubricoccaceae bacterium]|nr:hypothetical protein [Rubricoccaceae bacterium]
MARSALFALIVLLRAANAQPLVEAEVWDATQASFVEDGELFMGCSLACAYGWTTTASSALAPQRNNRYDAGRLEDGTATTAWVEGADGDGVGERLIFTLQASGEDAEEAPPNPDQPVPFWGIDVVNGYAKDEATWRANGRVGEFLMRINGQPVQRIRLADSMLPQSVPLSGELHVKPGDVIELEITAVYPGQRFHDTALSEIVLHGAH